MQRPSSINEETRELLPIVGVSLYEAKTPLGQSWQVLLPLTGVLGVPWASCVCVEMNFLGCNSYKEGMEEGQNGVS